MSIVKFLTSGRGRVTRVVAGVAFAATGVALGGGWLVLTGVGVVVTIAGGVDVCALAPLAGRPFKGHGAGASS
jgi:hypothetical protein